MRRSTVKKRFLAAGLCLLLTVGCAARPEEQPPELSPAPAEEKLLRENTETEAQAAEAAPQEEDLLAALPETFTFASGTGGWSTELSIEEDGTFFGLYHDSDMGDTGADFPYGTIYTCAFSGKFSQPVRLDDGSYSMRLESLETEAAPEVSYGDGVRYIASSPYGLESADEILIYPPGFRTADLSEEFLSWTGWISFDRNQEETIPFYGLYNVNEQLAFLAYPAEEET